MSDKLLGLYMSKFVGKPVLIKIVLVFLYRKTYINMLTITIDIQNCHYYNIFRIFVPS